MNRLWVRISLAISGVFLTLLILPTLVLLILNIAFQISREEMQMHDPRPPEPYAASESPDAPVYSDGRVNELRGRPPARDFISGIPRLLLVGILGIGFIGVVGGVVVSRIMATPITQLAGAAKIIGQGDFSHRVALKGSEEIQALAASFNQMAADLEQAEATRRNLMADVSHELRTPLTVLEGNLRAALDHVYELDDEELANLYSQTHHLIRLVNDLHELTLAEAHRLPLNIRSIDIAQLVEETLAIFEPLAEEKGVTLKYELPREKIKASVDDARMRQVLHNLVSNALRHTPADGQINVTVDSLTQALRIRIADSGEGIEPDLVPHIFDRFYRTDRSRSRDTGGTGLGLAIVKAIVEAHGGTITASSAGLGSGSQFSILLPKN